MVALRGSCYQTALLLALLAPTTAIHLRMHPPVAPMSSTRHHEPPTKECSAAAEAEAAWQQKTVPACEEGDAGFEERRLDEDGGAYTYEEFVKFYGAEEGRSAWIAAEPADEDVVLAVEAVGREAEETKRSALARLKRSAQSKISALRKAGKVAAQAAANATAALEKTAKEFSLFREWADKESARQEERAQAAEAEASAAQRKAEAEASGREEAEAAAAAARRAAEEAEGAATTLAAAKEEAAAASAMALTAAEARVASHVARAEEASERAARAEAATASLRSEVAGLQAEVDAQAEAAAEALEAAAIELAEVKRSLAASRCDLPRSRLAPPDFLDRSARPPRSAPISPPSAPAGRAEAAAAAEQLAAAQDEAARSAAMVEQWRRRAQKWQRRAGRWRRRAGGAVGAHEEEAEVAAAASEPWFQGVRSRLHLDPPLLLPAAPSSTSMPTPWPPRPHLPRVSSPRLGQVALAALAERDMMELARDEATRKWQELIGSAAPVTAGLEGSRALAAAAEHVAMLRGRSEGVWCEAEARPQGGQSAGHPPSRTAPRRPPGAIWRLRHRGAPPRQLGSLPWPQ